MTAAHTIYGILRDGPNAAEAWLLQLDESDAEPTDKTPQSVATEALLVERAKPTA